MSCQAQRRLAVVVAFAAIAILPGCNKQNAYVAPPPAKVTVATPIEQKVTLYAEFTGNTAPVASVDLEARVQGFLEKINVRDGAPVKQGQLLFEIEKKQYEAQYELQKAQLMSAEAKQANAEREYSRQSTLGQKDFASQRTVDEAKTALDTANAMVAVGRANLSIAENSLGYTAIKAPFNGVLTRHLVDVGALVGQSGPTKLATLVQVDPIHVYFNMSERQQIDMRDALAKQGTTLKQMRERDQDIPIELALPTDTTFRYKGKIDYIAPQVESGTGTLQMRGILSNKNIDLVPGLFVRVRVPIGMIDKALLVDDTAVASNQTGSYVLIVGKDDVVEQRQVTAGPLQGQLRVVTKGLAIDDKVVIGATQRAVPGNKVDPQPGQMTAFSEAAKPAPASISSDAASGR
ncbi:efflux RND transporter periplasmic adaptor subunit [Xanthobacteraceae bacterium Astr-EGSB]|uniref:efflux RND transporter periplasmic adaptor subunit n=1 Tax=Astrobacterium formosum TaxID=3069710 RepID=UPI0027B74E79|nr:efflux RND transporter periplasmic adaptor subunit [Xanthobacteraceae bacterium Astr-EGSB]